MKWCSKKSLRWLNFAQNFRPKNSTILFKNMTLKNMTLKNMTLKNMIIKHCLLTARPTKRTPCNAENKKYIYNKIVCHKFDFF